MDFDGFWVPSLSGLIFDMFLTFAVLFQAQDVGHVCKAAVSGLNTAAQERERGFVHQTLTSLMVWCPTAFEIQEGVNMRAHKRHSPNPLQIACAINVSSTPLIAWMHCPGDPAGRGNDWWTGVVPEVVLVCSASSFVDLAQTCLVRCLLCIKRVHLTMKSRSM